MKKGKIIIKFGGKIIIKSVIGIALLFTSIKSQPASDVHFHFIQLFEQQWWWGEFD
jgi:hypothetical protein